MKLKFQRKIRKPRKRLSTKALRDLATKNGKYTAQLALTRALKYNQCPAWAQKGKIWKQIEKIYIEAQILCLTTGRKYEVDHVVPLYHWTVRGLHVPANLQILSRRHNKVKSNHFYVHVESAKHRKTPGRRPRKSFVSIG